MKNSRAFTEMADEGEKIPFPPFTTRNDQSVENLFFLGACFSVECLHVLTKMTLRCFSKKFFLAMRMWMICKVGIFDVLCGLKAVVLQVNVQKIEKSQRSRNFTQSHNFKVKNSKILTCKSTQQPAPATIIHSNKINQLTNQTDFLLKCK